MRASPATDDGTDVSAGGLHAEARRRARQRHRRRPSSPPPCRAGRWRQRRRMQSCTRGRCLPGSGCGRRPAACDRMRSRPGPTPKPMPPTPISTETSLPFISTVARSIAWRVVSSSRSASSSTVVRPVSLGSTEIRPEAFLTRRRVLPGVSNTCTAGLLQLARRLDDAVVGWFGAAPVRKQQDSGAVRDWVKTGHVLLLS